MLMLLAQWVELIIDWILVRESIIEDALLQKSIDYEAQNNLKKALDYRVRALDEYVSILKGM